MSKAKSKAEKLRHKRAQASTSDQRTVEPRVATVRSAGTTRPTRERLQHGKWIMGKDAQPTVDLASDMIGRLYENGQLNTAQEQAARTFQELWASYRGEIGASEFRSCLAGSVGAYDDGDGNPAVYAAWYGLCDRIGRVSVAAIKMNVERQAGEKPINLPALQAALNRVAGA